MTAVVALVASRAAALGVVPAGGGDATVRSVDAIVWMDGAREGLIEAMVVEPGPRRLAILRAFPTAPSEIVPLDLAVVSELRAATHVGPPFHVRVRERLFGPSIMTPLFASMLREPAAPPVEPLPVERATAPRDAFVMFAGRTITSTITGRRSLPSDLEQWLLEAEVSPTAVQRELTSRALDLGWTVVAVVVDRADADRASTVGPWLYRFETTAPLIPPAVGTTTALPELRTYVVDDRPMVPMGRATTWNTTPWSPRGVDAAPANTVEPFEVTYWGPRDESATFRLRALLPTDAPSRVLRGQVLAPSSVLEETILAATTDAAPIPSRTGRGSVLDVLVCLLLGIAPLLYAPESWLLLWAAARARAQRTRGEPVGFAAALWPLYALVVALFWLVTLGGDARVAALGPLLIGLLRLFGGGPERERGPVRVDFKRKLKPAEKKDAAKAPAANAPAVGLSKPPRVSKSSADKPAGGPSKAPAAAPKAAPAGASKPAPAGASKPAPAGASKPPAATAPKTKP